MPSVAPCRFWVGAATSSHGELNREIQYQIMQHLQQIHGFFPLPTLMGPGEFFLGVFSPTRSFPNA